MIEELCGSQGCLISTSPLQSQGASMTGMYPMPLGGSLDRTLVEPSRWSLDLQGLGYKREQNEPEPLKMAVLPVHMAPFSS